MAPPRHPPPYRTDERALAAETRIDIYKGGGPGGQHRNKTENAVRLHHLPSGVVVTASERRSLEANRRAAFARLRERLERKNRVKPPRTRTRPTRSSVERRLEGKRREARIKSARRGPAHDD